jgi:hypothetical protein
MSDAMSDVVGLLVWKVTSCWDKVAIVVVVVIVIVIGSVAW